MHPCQIIYHLGAQNAQYGNTPGICVITGQESTGILFKKWVKPTFNDYAYLKPGTIISNQAAFCFDEASKIIQTKVGKEKPQRFRTYSHIVHNGQWHCFTKAHKQEIFNILLDNPEIVCLSDSGQKHLLFKHRPGLWQLEEMHIVPDTETLQALHSIMMELLSLGFSQAEVISGVYDQNRILKAGLDTWLLLDKQIKPHRGGAIYQLAAWLLWSTSKA